MTIRLFDVSGRQVDSILPESIQTAGAHQLDWEPAKHLFSGVYFAKLSVNGQTITRTLNLLR